MLSAICFNLDQSKILSSGNGLNANSDLYYTWSGLMAQFLVSALKEPQTMIYVTTSKFTPVNKLLNLDDSFTPTARITEKVISLFHYKIRV